MTAEKIRENRLRRMAARQGLGLSKSRTRDVLALDYGGFMIFDLETNGVVLGGSPTPFLMSIDDVEAFLTTPRDQRRLGQDT